MADFRSSANESSQPSEIVVRARKFVEPEAAVPISMTVLDPVTLMERQVRRLDDLSGVVPGLIVTSQISGLSPLLAIRGQRRPVADDLRLPVIAYFAGVPLPNEGSMIPIYDLKSIEVLRGPQGTLFGRNATGGALLLEPAAPGADGYIEPTFGNFRQFTLEGASDLINSESFGLRVAGQRSSREGFVRDETFGERLDNVHSESFRLVGGWRPSSLTNERFVLDYLRADEAGVADILRGVYPNPPAVTTGGTARLPANAPYFDCGHVGVMSMMHWPSSRHWGSAPRALMCVPIRGGGCSGSAVLRRSEPTP